MGCGASNAVVPLGPQDIKKIRKVSVLSENPPTINITGREDAKFVASPATKVIFIFGECCDDDTVIIIMQYLWYIYIGGPGSGKGRIVANLRSMFGMKLVSGESLIFKYLPKKVQHAMTLNSTCDMAALVRKDPSHVQVRKISLKYSHYFSSNVYVW